MKQEAFDAMFQELAERGRWGTRDNGGALNLLTPGRVVSAAGLVREGVTVPLGVELSTEISVDNPRPAVLQTVGTAAPGSDDVWFREDFIGVACHGEIHSHVDALNHCGYRGKFYNGHPAADVAVDGWGDLTRASAGIVGRGVLLDIPALRGVSWLEPGDSIVAGEILAAEDRYGMRVGEGDIALVRTGFRARRVAVGPWPAHERRAGLDVLTAALWRDRGISAIGCDGDCEVMPHRVSGVSGPMHCLLITALGIHMFDCLDLDQLSAACAAAERYEFLFVASPVSVPGATGATVNPVAIF